MIDSSLHASSKYWNTAWSLRSTRSTTSRDRSCARMRFALTDSACARNCSSRCDLGDLATLRRAADAQELGQRRGAVDQPARTVHGKRTSAAARVHFTQCGLARAVVNEPPQCFVDLHQLVDPGAPPIAGIAAFGAAHRLIQARYRRQA